MRAAFSQALDFLFENEGRVYSNHPFDSGGPTKFGVTLSAYSSYLGRIVTPSEIKGLTLEQVSPFYLDRYWIPMGCDQIADPAVAIALFDCSVLYGVGTAAILAQKASGAALKFDGRMGDKSIAAINQVSRDDFLKSFRTFILSRIDSVIELDSKNGIFRKGWTNRANRLLTLSVIAPLNREVT
jgi:lysozyme family protein